MEIQIITPEVSDDEISNDLRRLTKAICDKYPDRDTSYGLGGEHGYGTEWDSPVFEMRRFYWGDCDCGWEQLSDDWDAKNKHDPDCYQRKLTQAKLAAGWKKGKSSWLDEPEGWGFRKCREVEDSIRRTLCKEHGLPYPDGCAVHCTCTYEARWAAFLAEHSGHLATCSLELPNFRHKPTGFEVRWYKWIGRDNEYSDEGNWPAIFAECLADVGKGD